MHQHRKIIISGASGFIGSALTPFLEMQGHSVTQLVRNEPAGSSEARWTPGESLDIASLPAHPEVIINLSGSSIAVPFTDSNKRKILQSRLKSTRTLVEMALRLPAPPKLFISASGIGYYGSRGNDELDENSSAGDDFVADVCVQWEQALEPLTAAGIRSVALRTGIVLGSDGGALQKMLPAFRLGAGAVLGSGEQFMSWISLVDYLRSVQFLLETEAISGPVNIVSPLPVSNREFSRQLSAALHRPLLARAPAWVLRLGMGEMAESLLLASQRVLPGKLLEAGFSWEDSDLASTFEKLLAKG